MHLDLVINFIFTVLQKVRPFFVCDSPKLIFVLFFRKINPGDMGPLKTLEPTVNVASDIDEYTLTEECQL